MAKATTAPSGLAIARDGNKLTLSWKIPSCKYDEGQQFQYRIKTDAKWSDWTKVSIGKTVTRKTMTITLSNYYPTTNSKLDKWEFRVRGRRANTDNTTYTWSDWSEKIHVLNEPATPSLTEELSSQYTNVTTFTWDAGASGESSRWFANVEWQSILVKECTEKDGSKLTWKSSATGWSTGTGSNTGTKTITEDTTLLARNSYTRWLRVRARGAHGNSAWRYAKHVYATPRQAKVLGGNAHENNAAGYNCQVKWTASAPASNPIDSTVVQYAFAVPAAGFVCPGGASWTDANTSRDTAEKDMASFTVDALTGTDQCLYVRVNTVHDRTTTNGVAKLIKRGKLADPTNVSVSVNQQTFRATVTATNNSAVSDSFLAVKFRRSKDPANDYVIGIIPHGSTSVTVQCPDWTDDPVVAFGVYACVGTYTREQLTDGTYSYALNREMISDGTVWSGGDVPQAPGNVKVAATEIAGTIRVTWSWPRTKADATILSWADHSDAWESTDEPSEYTVTNPNSAAWNISGLAVGKEWFVRLRLVSGETYGPWSDTKSIDLSSEPVKPVLTLSKSTIRQKEDFTAYWAYISTDTTAQASAEICTATINNGTITYGSVIAHTETAQHVGIKCPKSWTTGQTYYLCLRLTSGSGHVSDWSDPVAVTVAEPLNAVISSTSLQTITISADDEQALTRSVLSLREMPLSITVTGAGAGGTTTVIVERAADYYLERPDETQFTGHEGETIALISQTGESAISIAAKDLLGTFDDGAQYRIRALVQDGLGQSSEKTLDFEVHWSHQAVMPRANLVLEGSAVKITPVSPTGAQTGDSCDIYRLSIDRPVLVVENAAFGQTYVDPYPAIGSYGGHRIVFKTKNGDYITADNIPAWIDLDDDFEADYSIIDFAGEQVLLRYNLGLTNSWKKDFKETKYLGGAVQGDWNEGFSRSLSISNTSVTVHDEETIAALRRLAVYPGICHVRTVEGSSFDADIQVSEVRSYQSAGRKVEFSLSVTRVDPEGLDGLPLDMWGG